MECGVGFRLDALIAFNEVFVPPDVATTVVLVAAEASVHVREGRKTDGLRFAFFS